MSPRVFTIIRHREGTNITSSIEAFRTDTGAAIEEVALLDSLIARMEEARLPEKDIASIRYERDHYLNLFMTPNEQEKLRVSLSHNNLGALGLGVFGSGITIHGNATIYNVEDPVYALQQVLDIYKGVITFAGAIELIYHDTMESSWIIVQESVVSEENGMTDIYSRFSANKTEGK